MQTGVNECTDDNHHFHLWLLQRDKEHLEQQDTSHIFLRKVLLQLKENSQWISLCWPHFPGQTSLSIPTTFKAFETASKDLQLSQGLHCKAGNSTLTSNVGEQHFQGERCEHNSASTSTAFSPILRNCFQQHHTNPDNISRAHETLPCWPTTPLFPLIHLLGGGGKKASDSWLENNEQGTLSCIQGHVLQLQRSKHNIRHSNSTLLQYICSQSSKESQMQQMTHNCSPRHQNIKLGTGLTIRNH